MKKPFLTLSFLLISILSFGQVPSKVDYDAFEVLVAKVKPHRAERLISVEDFNKMSQEKDVIILDTRSKAMYEAKHIKGAIHLNFSDFTQDNLAKIIPSPDTKILIYCNNNFDEDEEYFPTKMAKAPTVRSEEQLTLALNIPTYINLYGYGYRNVHELKELVSIYDKRITLEGKEVPKIY